MLLATLMLLGILVGSHGGRSFDAELIFYAIGSVLTAGAIGFRFMHWAQRPPTRRYLLRGWQFLRDRRVPLAKRGQSAGRAFGDKMLGQGFIRRRSLYRWVMHLCLSGGCTLAFAITFPLVFGWVHFEPFNGNASLYAVHVFGIPVDRFSVASWRAFLIFNSLNIAGVIVLLGVGMAIGRRCWERGERATQRFWEDIVPLLLILAVTVTGLGLTVSYKLMNGQGHGFLVVVHLVSVLALLFFIPFGKLFHMFQRIASLCVTWYRQVGETGPQAACARCLLPFASSMQVSDLKDVLDELGFNYRFQGKQGAVHYQDVCPACRRRLVVLNQGRSVGR